MLDGRSAKPRNEVTIHVRNDRVHAITNGYTSPTASPSAVIDLKKYTVLPGLIDAHTHLTLQHNKKSYSERFYMGAGDYALRASVHARRTLMAGFTAVRDLGDRHNVSIALRNAIQKDWVIGPRIYTSAAAIATTGGHADPSNGLSHSFSFDPKPTQGVINGPHEARQAVRQRYKEGANLIKITATGGVLSVASSGQNPQFSQEELLAVMDTARDYGFKVAVHAHGAEGMKRALKAGVASIEHATYMDSECIALFKKTATYYVPTISAGRFVAEKARVQGYFPEVIRPKAIAIGTRISETFTKALQAGVPIAFGTDSGVSPHGANAQEFVYMVEAGMKPIDAILSSTLHSAKLIGDEHLGAISPNSYADIIAVKHDPLVDIKALLDVSFVMKGGKVIKQPHPHDLEQTR
ncbi:MAG: amidohydrolase family protein [Myxococcales bacterium]|nr:amidohydrolase family protein [Myxococcales bacterium]